jgi:hypothetical protein
MKNKRGQFGFSGVGQNQNMFSNMIILIIFLVIVSIAGLLAGVIYYDMNVTDSILHTLNFDIPVQVNSTVANATQINNFQDILSITAYPILGLKSALPYLSYFMVFAFIIAMAITAYVSSKNPVFFIVHILFTILVSYFCIILSNLYIGLMSNAFINSMMINFTIYNKLMFYLPQIVFFTSLLFGLIAFINVIKPQTNSSATGINYGGDY